MSAGAPIDTSFPLTPHSIPEEYAGIAHVMRHNAATPYAQDSGRPATTAFMGSEHGTTYSSPASNHWAQENFGQESHGSPYQYSYPNPEFVGQSQYRAYGRGTPPTPAKSDISIGDSRYHGGPQWTRSQSNPKTKTKKSRKKGEEESKLALPTDKPIPILSKDSEGPIQDIERFVHRSIELRHKEVEGKNGYRPRPMNNFMLYRKAYQERAKQVSNQNNHQVVSMIVAASWKHEAQEVKDKFARYAQIEKDNHITAFPDYQFRPNKSQKSKKRKGPGFDSEEDPWSDLGDNDPERKASTKKQRMRPKNAVYVDNYGMNSGYIDHIPQHTYGRNGDANFNVLNPGKPPPIPMVEHGRYFEPIMQGRYSTGFEEASIHWNPHGLPRVPNFGLNSQISGLPGAGDALLQPDTLEDYGGGHHAGQLDPMLATEEPVASGPFTQGEFENLDSMELLSGWDEPRLSVDGTMLAMQNRSGEGTYDDQDFEQFLKPTN